MSTTVKFGTSQRNNRRTVRRRQPARGSLECVFLDIGSGGANHALRWLSKNKRAHAFCFDPQEECFQQATDAAKKQPRLHPYSLAVSAAASSSNADTDAVPELDKNTLLIERPATFYEANDRSSSSLLPFNPEGVGEWKNPDGRAPFRTLAARQVSTVRMDEFLDARRIATVAFARIETQGSALDVVKSFGAHITSVMEFAIKVHVTDFDIYTGQTHKEELDAFMRTQGFSIYGTVPCSKEQEAIVWYVNKRFLLRNMEHFDAPARFHSR